ncbi:RNA polymerase recycling motor HelD [Lactobacillus sp. Sy-1]|uniref:RNA polymerase recycling motor HelD n=1 Tax=Lactobacillus sp. Sy-1 TaxID=2109645 RepID=UPI001C59932B|nr:RNA polymerase recycling motor HelD [Lactobacillus sp. Sy-1]MBW1604816.1 AAA family ATPase [Lactobacillus sp. Sy-1]
MEPGEYQKEQKRVDSIVKQIKSRIEKTKVDLSKAHEETKNVQQNYSANTSVNYFEVDDRIETSAELQQQRGLVNRDIENETIIKRHLNTLKELANSPYFGRIDILDDGETTPEQLYIGTASFVDDQQNFLVYDWRAPISSIYYNGTLGKVSYTTPAGRLSTELLKKRQFQIQAGQIDNMFDTNETVGDEMLQHALGEQNDETMQNIVATIQSEQNDIIRDTTSDLLVVQGVAGSGKTSAILQRIAFLLYHSRSSLVADQIVLLSPNKLFSHYISDVLPSLGERNMRQVTLAEFFNHRFEGLKVQTIFDRYENQQVLSSEQIAIHNYKGSAQFMNDLANYVANIAADDIQFSSIGFRGKPFFTAEDIRSIYQQYPQSMHTSQRILKTKNQLIRTLKRRIHTSIHDNWVNKELESLSEERIRTMMKGKQLRDFQGQDDERDFLATKIVKKEYRIIYDAIYNNNFFDPYIQYEQFLKQLDVPDHISNQEWEQSVKQFSDQLENHQLSLDNAAPQLYLRDLITGEGRNRAIKYLFIDEMQDYSIAQLVYLRFIFSNAKFNLIGDSEQALFKAVEKPNDLLIKLDAAFKTKHSRLITLRKSYRSTYQITTFAKSLLPDGNEIEAFNRQGPIPEIIVRYDNKVAINSLKASIKQQLLDNGTVAIITKNMDEAKLIYHHLYREFKTTLLDDADRTLPKGAIVLPVYLAKGLEFDSVIGWNVSDKNYDSTDLIGTLYTIATRAMHSLILISIGPVSSLITKAGVPNNAFKIDHQISSHN